MIHDGWTAALWSAAAGGVVGTAVLTTLLRAANELGYTRIDLPFLLGSMFTDHRSRAKAYGYALHFAMGFGFALLYAGFFLIVGQSGWLLGSLLGALHASFVGTALVNVLLPIVHPRIGTPDSAANHVALLEPPGFLMLNYGRSTFLVTLVGHIAFGAIVGATFRV